MRIVRVDLSNPVHARDVRVMTAAYAEDPMGHGGPLPDDVLDRLVPALREHPASLLWLAYEEDEPVGIATCFLGFSTFAARPLINVHDLSVRPAWRGRGIGRALLAAVEAHGRAARCVKVTLEVGELNARARRLYESCGFTHALAGEEAGPALFLSKTL